MKPEDTQRGPYSEDSIVNFRAELRGAKRRARDIIAKIDELDDEIVALLDKLHESGGK
jgi:hypothetical protein